MSDLRDDGQLDLLLRASLRQELDGQLGRAGDRFREHLRQQGPLTNQAPPPAWARRGPWVLGLVGSAMAASIAALLAAPGLWPRPGSIGPSGTNSGLLPAVRVDHTVRSQYYDAGTFVTEDGTPMRRLRRLNRHELHWMDERSGERVEQVLPSEDVMLYELKTY